MQAYFESRRDYDALFHIGGTENDHYPAHFHSNIEILYVVDGEMDVTINQQTRRLPAGALAVSNSFDVHAYHTPDSSKSIRLIIPLEMAGDFQRATDKQRFESPFLLAGPHSQELESSLHFLMRYDQSKGSMVSKGHIYVVLGTLLRHLRLVPDEGRMGADDLIRSMLLYLEKNYLHGVTMQELAAAFGYNKSYLSRVFNRYINLGFSEYVNQLRVRHAARLIQTTGHSMSRIAEESGFSSVRSFNRAFQELYQITPLEYKKHKSRPTEKGKEIDHLSGVFSYLPQPEDG